MSKGDNNLDLKHTRKRYKTNKESEPSELPRLRVRGMKMDANSVESRLSDLLSERARSVFREHGTKSKFGRLRTNCPIWYCDIVTQWLLGLLWE